MVTITEIIVPLFFIHLGPAFQSNLSFSASLDPGPTLSRRKMGGSDVEFPMDMFYL
jgi:hypothetical protein